MEQEDLNEVILHIESVRTAERSLSETLLEYEILRSKEKCSKIYGERGQGRKRKIHDSPKLTKQEDFMRLKYGNGEIRTSLIPAPRYLLLNTASRLEELAENSEGNFKEWLIKWRFRAEIAYNTMYPDKRFKDDFFEYKKEREEQPA